MAEQILIAGMGICIGAIVYKVIKYAYDVFIFNRAEVYNIIKNYVDSLIELYNFDKKNGIKIRTDIPYMRSFNWFKFRFWIKSADKVVIDKDILDKIFTLEQEIYKYFDNLNLDLEFELDEDGALKMIVIEKDIENEKENNNETK